MLTRQEIEEILPHREPFLWLDRVLELEPGLRAVAEKHLSGKEDVFRGHFPGYPVFPGVLLLEALAQTGAVAVLTLEENRGRLALFGGVDGARFRRQVVPGDTLRFEVELVRVRGPVGKGKGTAYVGDDVVCSATLTFAVVEPS
ncbi:MAG: 3-hydroxyacyl-ACP dehydratase FabZ [Thermoleophilia bacterium]